MEALSLKIAVPPAAYNISVAVGLIEAIFSGTFSKVTSCPRASITTNGSAVSDSLAAGAGFDAGLAAGAAALVGSGATVATGAGSAVGSGA